MAARLVSSRARVVAYMPNLRSMVRHFRAFSTYDESTQSEPVLTVEETPILDSMTEYPDPRLGPLAPRDKRFPMPGLVGATMTAQSATPQQPSLVTSTNPDVLTTMMPQERQAHVLQQYMTINSEVTAEELDEILDETSPQSPSDILECQAISCPALMRKDFQDLFPQRDLMSGPLTIITVSQKTEHNMTGWDPDVEEEREQLLDSFVTGAQEICEALTDAGYWADFIDPSSGRPYLGDFTNATMFETDDRYRHFGFEIEDLGCCKVISHHLWGTHSYVGCLFTNAPVTHQVIRQMLKKHDWDD